jgi:hypothetical protein
MSINAERAFRVLHPGGRSLVLQPDDTGVIRPLADGTTGAPFFVSNNKLRRALAGQQRQVFCRCRANGRENGFFARVDEFVGVDPDDGAYVILSPLVRVLETTHGDPLIRTCPNSASPTSPAGGNHVP